MYFIIFAITIALLQVNAYSESVIVKTIPMMVSAISLFYFLSMNNGKKLFASFKTNALTILLLGLVLIGNLRSNHPDQTLGFTISRTINTILLFGAVFSAIHYYKNKYSFSVVDIVVYFIVAPYLIYCLINFLLWASGISVQESVLTDEVVSNEAVILSYLGINIDRVQFPLSTGLNNYAVVIGAMFTICLILLFVLSIKKYKLFISLSCVVFLATLLLIDSRASIYYPILICFAIKAWQNSKQFVKLIPNLTYIVILGPLFLYMIVPLMLSLPFIDSLTRNSEELATGNSRFLIWSACLLEFLSFKPIHIIGYGYFGHFGSGVSAAWASIFSTWNDGDLKTSHNTLFTILFDHGYIGLLIYILVIFRTVKRISIFWNFNKEANAILLGFFTFNLLAGITETLIGFYSPNYFILFFLFLFTESIGNSFILIKKKNNYRNMNINSNVISNKIFTDHELANVPNINSKQANLC